ncbi:MAG: hypothetical protein H8K11_01495 [Nitrospira sp.]|nr:hypothetical protein [Nitrospira sp.]
MNRFRVALIPALLSLSACAMTVKEFRETPLTYLAEVPGHHAELANCLMHRLEESVDTWPNMFRLTSEKNHSSLMINRQQLSGAFMTELAPLAELIITQTDPSQVLIEERHRSGWNAYEYPQKARRFFSACGQQSISHLTFTFHTSSHLN